MRAIFRKELADYFSSFRFLILLVIVLLISAATLYFDYRVIRGTTIDTELVFLTLFTTLPEDVPSLFSYINFFALFISKFSPDKSSLKLGIPDGKMPSAYCTIPLNTKETSLSLSIA